MGQFFDTYPSIDYDFLSNGLYQKVPDIFRQVRVNQTRLNPAIAYQWVDVQDRRPDQLSFDLYGSVSYHWTFFIINEGLYNGDRGWPLAHHPLDLYIREKYDYKTIRLYREASDHIDYNRVDDRFDCKAKMVGMTSKAVGTVIGRDLPMNTLHFLYDNDKVFKEWEEIWFIEETDWYAYGWEDQYVELRGWDETTMEEALYYSDIGLIDKIYDKYDIRDGINSIHHWNDTERGYWYTNYENIDYVLTPDSPTITFKTNLEYEEELNFEKGKIKVVRPDFIEQFASEYKRLINL